MPQRKAASVFPEPVGAQISVSEPEAIAGQPAACAGVGASNDAWNHFLTGSEKSSRGDFWVADVLMANLLTLPTAAKRAGTPGSGAFPTSRRSERRQNCGVPRRGPGRRR